MGKKYFQIRAKIFIRNVFHIYNFPKIIVKYIFLLYNFDEATKSFQFLNSKYVNVIIINGENLDFILSRKKK